MSCTSCSSPGCRALGCRAHFCLARAPARHTTSYNALDACCSGMHSGLNAYACYVQCSDIARCCVVYSCTLSTRPLQISSSPYKSVYKRRNDLCFQTDTMSPLRLDSLREWSSRQKARTLGTAASSVRRTTPADRRPSNPSATATQSPSLLPAHH